jgi:hypothetical protein
MDPETVHVADMAIELCDGRPSMVQSDLSYWIGTVGQFCPWGARSCCARSRGVNKGDPRPGVAR